MVDAEGSNLFVVFFLSLYSLVLIPLTIHKLCNLGSEDRTVVRPWQKGAKQNGFISRAGRQLLQPGTLLLVCGWVLFAVLVFYVQGTAKDSQPFDPYSILEVERGATERDVKRAYRKLSLQFHPDKNPDPEAAKYFAEYITKAYKALSDPIARKNYEEHGHPDGPQSFTMGIALPKWLLEADSKSAPVLLAALVFGGVLLPLIVAACYLLRTDQYVGPNGIMADTYNYFLYSPAKIKEGQGLARIMETLTVAMEFITMPTPADQMRALEGLRKWTLRVHPDLRDKKPFWARKSSCVKAHMLLMAHLEREPIDPTLQKDLLYVLKKTPVLVEEIIKLASMPRGQPGVPSYGWLSPVFGSIEFLQHLTQAVPLSARKNPGSYKGLVEGPAPLLQLPHVDAEVVRKLLRKRVRGLPDLQALSSDDRKQLLAWSGLDADQVDDAETALTSIPSITVSASCSVDGETEVFEGDVVTCKVKLQLSRPSHATTDLRKDGKGVAVFAPHFPMPREERWFLFVADPLTNEVISPPQHISLLDAEYYGAMAAATAKADGTKAQEATSNGDDQAADKAAEEEEEGQVVDVQFQPINARPREYTLFVCCDSWIGCDRVVPLKMRVQELSRAVREGRATRGGGKVIPLDEYGNPEEADEYVEEDGEYSVASSDDEEVPYEYDSEDSGTEESGSDEEDEEEDTAAARARKQDGSDSGSDDSSAENLHGVVPKAATLQAKG